MMIEAWSPDHPRLGELRECIHALGQESWVDFAASWHQSSHLLAACLDGRVAGFLRFVVQLVGAEDDLSPVVRQCAGLLEAKILAFGVAPDFRRRGIGRALQERALEEARRLGCYQVRSHSSGINHENHRLKLAMGFGVHPVVRGDDREGVYFIMPLAARQYPDAGGRE